VEGVVCGGWWDREARTRRGARQMENRRSPQLEQHAGRYVCRERYRGVNGESRHRAGRYREGGGEDTAREGVLSCGGGPYPRGGAPFER